LEIGFGTGLNALLTAIETEKMAKTIHYTTLEKFPVPTKTALQLNYSDLTAQNILFENIQKAEWGKVVEISKAFSIKKIECDFTDATFNEKFDLVYFDAFSPEKQPEMWTEEQFLKIYNACNAGAILTTYCAKGIVRRTLQAVGFNVERLPGPPGKREILRAIKPN
jgi:tRNA U34 5-methylaminomethyl-2-thiouridine-forming methyltransferase MnmC